MLALKPAERLVIDLLYLQQKSVADIQEIDRLEQKRWSRCALSVPARK